MDVINTVEKILAGENVSINQIAFNKAVREKIAELKTAQTGANTSCEKAKFVEFMKNPTPSENPEFQKIYETVTTLRDIQKAIDGAYVGTNETFVNIQKRCVAQDAQIKHDLATLQSYVTQALGELSVKTVVPTVTITKAKSPLTITKCKIAIGEMVEKTSKIDEIAQEICDEARVNDDWKSLFYEELPCFDMPISKQYVYPAPWTVAFCRTDKMFYVWMPAIGSTAVEVFTFEPFIFTNMSGFVHKIPDGVSFITNAVGYASRVNTDLRPGFYPLQKYFCTTKPDGKYSIELPPKNIRSAKGSGIEVAAPIRSLSDHYQILAAFAGKNDSWLLDTNERPVYGKTATEEMNRIANHETATSLVIRCKREARLTREVHGAAIPTPTVTVTETPYLQAAKKAATNRFEALAGHEESQEAVASPFGAGKPQTVSNWAEDEPDNGSDGSEGSEGSEDSGEESDNFE